MAKITMEHGSGGSATDKLISEIFSREFYNDEPGVLEDAAVVGGSGTLAMTMRTMRTTTRSMWARRWTARP